MRTTALLTAALLCGAPALAQTSKPTAPADSGNAGAMLAKLLKAAKAKKLLQHRLFTKRYYEASERGRVMLVIGEGKHTADGGVEFSLSADVFTRSRDAGLTYRFDKDMILSSVTFREAREYKEKRRERKMVIQIAGGKTTRTEFKDGVPRGNPKDGVWTGERISLFSTLVLLPSLGDLGLEPTTTVHGCDEDDDIGKNRKGDTLVVRREQAGKATQVVWVEEVGRSRPVAKVIMGVGKDQGLIKEFILDPKPDGRSDMHIKLIDKKKADELKKLAPILGNEYKATSALRSVYYAQRSYQRQKNEFAANMDDLAAGRMIYDKELKEGKSPGYMILISRSPDKQSWMAIAVPEDQGKTGRYFFVINNQGNVHRTKKPIEMKEDCAIPSGAERVR